MIELYHIVFTKLDQEKRDKIWREYLEKVKAEACEARRGCNLPGYFGYDEDGDLALIEFKACGEKAITDFCFGESMRYTPRGRR